jgi:hypothetical protein
MKTWRKKRFYSSTYLEVCISEILIPNHNCRLQGIISQKGTSSVNVPRQSLSLPPSHCSGEERSGRSLASLGTRTPSSNINDVRRPQPSIQQLTLHLTHDGGPLDSYVAHYSSPWNINADNTIQPSHRTRLWPNGPVRFYNQPTHSKVLNAHKLLDMHSNRHKFFRWTPRTAGLTFIYVVAFPAFVGYLGYVTDVSRWA